MLFYDADCGVCTALAEWARRDSGVTIAAIQSSKQQLLGFGIEESRLLDEAYSLCDGTLLRGPDAMRQVLRMSKNPAVRLIGAAAGVPILRDLTARGYRMFAKHRARISVFLGYNQCA